MTTAPVRGTPVARAVAASFVGTAIEWYDFFLYGTAAALVFNRLFFPTVDSVAGTMAAFGTYAVGFVARPFGALSDRVGRKPVYLGGAAFLACYAFPFFLLVGTRRPEWVYAALGLGMVGHAAMYGPQAAFLSELFGTRVRYTGASLGYQLAAPLSGGGAPLVATALLAWSDGDPWPVGAYLIAMALVTVVAVLLAAETRSRDLGGG